MAVSRRVEAPPHSGDDSVDDALATIGLAQQSIAGADIKASILGAACAVLLGVVANRLDASALWAPGPVVERASAILSLTTLLLIGWIGYHLGRVLLPRTSASVYSRYAWPSIVDAPIDDLVGAPSSTRRREAWSQAKMVAEIARIKHTHLRHALRWFAATALLAATSVVSGASQAFSATVG